ncbi:hypothetical protein [Spirosoma areae]
MSQQPTFVESPIPSGKNSIRLSSGRALAEIGRQKNGAKKD